MKRKSMMVAVLMASMVLGACGKKTETSVVEDPVVSEAPAEETTTEETPTEEASSGETQTGETTEEASNEAATGETEQSTKGVDVGDYLENFGELKNILQMITTECWQFPNAQSYVSDGFYLEWQGETFSMKNEGNQAVALYGIHIGDEAGASGKAMTDHGWTEYQYGGYIMQTDKAQYYMELESDENGKVTSWYLNNWPEGDITEAYDSLEKQ